MKSVLISVQPKWCKLIASGKKTIEVRKTAPKEVPFKVYMYCTKDGYMYRCRIDENRLAIPEVWNGKVVGEFVCDKVEKYTFSNYEAEYRITDVELIATCLNHPELITYGKGKPLYGLHISELKIYDEPRKLSDFVKPCPIKSQDCAGCEFYSDYIGKCVNRVTRPPQSWCYIEAVEE